MYYINKNCCNKRALCFVDVEQNFQYKSFLVITLLGTLLIMSK